MCSISHREYVGCSLSRAVSVLQNGGIVAFPTETYYGLAIDPDCESAVAKLFEVKQRQAHKPLLLLIDSIEQLNELVSEIPFPYHDLIKKYWPGPLTLIFPARDTLSKLLTGNSGTVGARISPHPIARELVRKMGKPITATSANLSGRESARSALEVLQMFKDKIDYILDGGETAAGLCSTVCGLKNGVLTVLREGQVDLSSERAVTAMK